MTVRDSNLATQLDAFLCLIVLTSIPFWLLGVFSEARLLPYLPVSGLMAVCPGLVAMILTWRSEGREGALALLARLSDWRSIPSLWWGVALALTIPALLTLAYSLMWLAGTSLPDTPKLDFAALPLLLTLFTVGAIGEELGWSAFALDRMQQKWSVLSVALVLGAYWTFWHVIPLMQTGRTPDWILWHAIVTLATRIVLVWFYFNTRQSVFGQALFHAMSNVGFFMFPNSGSHYSAAFLAPLIIVLAIPCAIGLVREPRRAH